MSYPGYPEPKGFPPLFHIVVGAIFWTAVLHFTGYLPLNQDALDFVCAQERTMKDKAATIAMIAHSINKALCESIGDHSQLTWKDAPQWQKDSAINGVKLHLANPETTPEQTHEAWMREKAADGWAYGEVKDADRKEHPCMVPYHKLPESQRSKDYLFKAVVETMKDIL